MAEEFSLPDEQLSGFIALRDLGVEGVKALTAAIRNAGVLLRSEELEKAVQRVAPKATEQIVDVLLYLAFSTWHHRLEEGLDVFETATDRLRSLPEEARWSDDQFERWIQEASALRELFNLENLLVLGKAFALEYQHDQVLGRAVVLTDIRPIFDTAGSKIVAGIVSHTLRIEYVTPNGRESISFMADQADLRSLVEECQRAIQKAKATERFLTEQGKLRVSVSGE